MTEPIEVWREEFEVWASDYPGNPLDKMYMLETWLAAKRSQPVVVFPNDTEIEKLAKSTAAEYKFDHEDDSTMFIKSFVYGGLVASDEIVRRMRKAGIAYTVEK